MPANHPWDRARKLPCVRGNGLYDPAPLEPGVRFFVLMLEQLGCTTGFSCEGHPRGFYITFDGPAHVARAIAASGFFQVELSGAGYRLGLDRNESHGRWTTRCRNEVLRWAAAVWVQQFGELNSAAPPAVPHGLNAVGVAFRSLLDAAALVVNFRIDDDVEVREGSLDILTDAVDATRVTFITNSDILAAMPPDPVTP